MKPIGDQSATSRNQSPTGCLNLLMQVVKRTGCCMSCLKACYIETYRRLVTYREHQHFSNQSPINWRPVGDHFATYATSSRSIQSQPVFCACSKDSLRLISIVGVSSHVDYQRNHMSPIIRTPAFCICKN